MAGSNRSLLGNPRSLFFDTDALKSEGSIQARPAARIDGMQGERLQSCNLRRGAAFP